MKKKLLLFALLISFLYLPNVFADNIENYTLTITKDYEFKEVIKYKIQDYENVSNGDNFFANLLTNEPIYTDIAYRTQYKKSVSKSNGTYYVTLSHTYTEYTMSNARLLNNCFEESSFDHDMDTYNLNATGFTCNYADQLVVKIITDFKVDSTNASISGNTYTWILSNNELNMEMSLTKEYTQKEESNSAHGINEDEDEEQQDTITDEIDKVNEEQTKAKISKTVIIAITTVVVIGGLTTLIILKKKNSNLNKI